MNNNRATTVNRLQPLSNHGFDLILYLRFKSAHFIFKIKSKLAVIIIGLFNRNRITYRPQLYCQQLERNEQTRNCFQQIDFIMLTV